MVGTGDGVMVGVGEGVMLGDGVRLAVAVAPSPGKETGGRVHAPRMVNIHNPSRNFLRGMAFLILVNDEAVNLWDLV